MIFREEHDGVHWSIRVCRMSCCRRDCVYILSCLFGHQKTSDGFKMFITTTCYVSLQCEKREDSVPYHFVGLALWLFDLMQTLDGLSPFTQLSFSFKNGYP